METTTKASALQGSLEEELGQDQEGQGEIVLPWPNELLRANVRPLAESSAVEQLKQDTGYP